MLTLTGKHVRLEPLDVSHAAALAVAASSDRSSFGWTTVPDGIAGAEAFIAAAAVGMALGTEVPFAVRAIATDEVVGSTRFLGIARWTWPGADGEPDAVEIGATWYSAAAQGTVVNPEAKLLMLTHAFDVWHVQRVQLKTDARNARSRAGIAKLGAQFEGILRNFQPGLGPSGEGTGARDTAMYAIVPAEWPDIRDSLRARVAAFAAT